MNTEKLTNLKPIEIGYKVDPDIPVIPFSLEVENAVCSESHSHPRGQLIYASRGVMKVICEKDIWIVPPSQAVWVPSEHRHEVYFPGKVSLANLFIDSSLSYLLSNKCVVIKVNELLKQLIDSAVKIGDVYSKDSSSFRLMMVLIDQIAEAEISPLDLPLGEDIRLLRVIEKLRDKPSCKQSLESLSHSCGASARTINRLFIKETGLAFHEWRTRLLLHTSLEFFEKGLSVTEVALELDYQSVSSFIEMFKRNLGRKPSEFLKSRNY